MEEAPLRPVRDDDLVRDLAIFLTVDARRLPPLHSRDTTAKDKARHEFAAWLAGRLAGYGYRLFKTDKHPEWPTTPSAVGRQHGQP